MNRKQLFLPVAIAPPVETDPRSRQAFLANKRQELRAPAGALLELSEMVLADATDSGHPEFLRDQQEVHAAASHLLTMINEVLDPLNTGAGEDELLRRVRHDLRTPLTEIIGVCELWLEDVTEQFLHDPVEGFAEDLQAMVRLSKKLVEDLNGLMDFGQVASDPEIDLDRLAPAQAELIRDVVCCLPATDVNLAARPRETGRILVVEDNPINCDVLARRLIRDGHTVVKASDGRQGLALARLGEFDLILLDIIMPELNGLQMLEQLKADPRLRHVPVIMISAFHELDGVVRCLEMGAEDYLAKPFNPVLLRARIDGCLEKKRLRDREVRYLEEIERQRKRADELLHLLLPGHVVQELKVTPVKPRRYEDVAILFCDLVCLACCRDQSQPEEAVPVQLPKLLGSWEGMALRHGVEKIRTNGDAFVAAAGFLPGTDNPVLNCLRCGLEMLASCRALPTGWSLRLGIHMGPVVAGLIGRRHHLFDLGGDTVNMAARMESHGVPGSITLSATAWRHVAHCCRGESEGLVPIRGLGVLEIFRFTGFLES